MFFLRNLDHTLLISSTVTRMTLSIFRDSPTKMHQASHSFCSNKFTPLSNIFSLQIFIFKTFCVTVSENPNGIHAIVPQVWNDNVWKYVDSIGVISYILSLKLWFNILILIIMLNLITSVTIFLIRILWQEKWTQSLKRRPGMAINKL